MLNLVLEEVVLLLVCEIATVEFEFDLFVQDVSLSHASPLERSLGEEEELQLEAVLFVFIFIHLVQALVFAWTL